MFSKKKISLTDEELVKKYSESLQKEYLSELYTRYATLAYGTCMKYLKDPEKAKDASMDVFEKLMNDLPKYNVSNFKSWLYIVVKNHCLQMLRNDQNHQSLDLMFEKVDAEDVESAQILHHHDTDANEEALQAMEKVLEELDESQKTCVKLFYLDKCSYAEITEKTGYSFNEVKSHVQNGKRNLKIKLLKVMTSMVILLMICYK